MSKQGIRSWLLLFLFFSTFSCTKMQKDAADRHVLIRIAREIAGEEYNYVYKSANDSIENWINNDLVNYKYEKINSWRLDSLICFNRKRDKAVMAILTRATAKKTSVQDAIFYFYGIKIKDRWIFFKGETIVLPREMYQTDTDHPLSFSLLQKIAFEEVFANYAIKRENSWQINEQYFEYRLGNDAYSYPYTTQEAWEASYIKLINENWKKRIKEPLKTP